MGYKSAIAKLAANVLAPRIYKEQANAVIAEMSANAQPVARGGRPEDIANAAGHRTISLIAEDTHLDALRLYRAKGYQEIARRPVVKGDWAVEAAATSAL